MEKITLNAQMRDKAGKGHARALRREDSIPAVVYRGGEAQPIKLDLKELSSFIKKTSGEQVIVTLKFPEGTSKLALLKEYQVDPIKGELLHSDFFEVSLTEELKVIVHVSLTGEAIGVKRDGGILQYGLREVEVQCLPDKIPGRVEVDVSELLTGHSLHVSDLRFSEGVTVLSDPDELLVTVTMPVVEEAPTPEEAPAEEEAAEEPEVAKKGKEEEEGKEKEKEKGKEKKDDKKDKKKDKKEKA